MSETDVRDPSMPVFNPVFAVFLRRQLVTAVENYRAAGRKFGALAAAALQEVFASAFATWLAEDNPAGSRALNDASAEFLLRRQPAPLDLIVDKVSMVFEGHGKAKALDREPVTVIAIGRWLYAPCLGGLLAARDEDSAAQQRDFRAICQAVLAVMPRREAQG